MTTTERWVRFNLVGLGGFVVQLATLAALTRFVSVPAAVAVSLAVLAAVSHNFLWHERVTWPGRGPQGRALRWLMFNLSTGVVSVVTNVAVSTLVVAATGAPLVAANVVAVVVASIANFVIGDHVVFGRQQTSVT